MRSFGIISPQFWTGRTGREIQAAGAEAIILATYLMTSPHSHMCGLYYLPKQYVAIDTGRPIKAIEKAFKDLALLPSGAFSFYDENSQYVWVPEMMQWQVGPLKPRDSRIGGIIKWYGLLPGIPFIAAFFDRYSETLPGLEKRENRKNHTPPQGGLTGASRGGVTGPKGPPSPDPAPVSVPAPDSGLEGGSGETKPNDPKAYGEFHHALLTDAQYASLEAQMGAETLIAYIRRFDRWKEQNKTVKKYRGRQAHLTIPDWYERDLGDDKIKARASPPLFAINGNGQKGETHGQPTDPNFRAAADYLNRRLAPAVRAGVPDVREDP